MADKPFVLIGVNSDKDIDVALKYVKDKDINWRSFWAGEDGVHGPIPVKWSIGTWPSSFIIDAKGVIRYKNLRGEDMDNAITKLLAEAGHEVEIQPYQEKEKSKDD